MLPSHSDLSFFLEVSKTLNLSRAAERIGISQPALSQSVKRLEYAFGQPVLIRSKTGVKLTKAGQKLALHARQLLQDWERIKSDAAKDEKEVRGRYSIGCHPSVALYTLKHFVPELLAEHPHLEMSFHHDLSRRITEQVISFKLDFGIVVNPTPHPDLVIRELMKDEVLLWTNGSRTPQNNTKKDAAVLICDPDLIQSQTLMNQLARKGIKFNRILTSSSLEVVADLVKGGAGVGIIPTKVAKNEDSKELKVLPDSPKFNDKICLIYRVDSQKSDAGRELARSIEKMLK